MGRRDLQPAEIRILEALTTAWNEYLQLPDQLVDDREAFRRKIHEMQRLIGFRVARRTNPELWV